MCCPGSRSRYLKGIRGTTRDHTLSILSNKMRPRFEKDSDSDDDDDDPSPRRVAQRRRRCSLPRRVAEYNAERIAAAAASVRQPADQQAAARRAARREQREPYSGAPRERMLLCGAGAAWSVGREVGDALRSSRWVSRRRRRFWRAGAGGRVRARRFNCPRPRAHRRQGRAAHLERERAPAVGLQTPTELGSFTCDRKLRGGASAVGFAGGKDAPFVWVAERERTGSAVYAYDWRARVKAAERGEENKIGAIERLPGGPGRRVRSVVSDGMGVEVVSPAAARS